MILQVEKEVENRSVAVAARSADPVRCWMRTVCGREKVENCPVAGSAAPSTAPLLTCGVVVS